MKACKKLFAVIAAIVAFQSEIAWSGCLINSLDEKCLPVGTSVIRAPEGSPVRSRHTVRDNPPLQCGQNAFCGDLSGDFDWVYGQVGVYYFNTNVNRNVFVPLYVKEAALSEEEEYIIPYMIPKWDGKVFWMKINPASPPLWLQPFYLDDDPSCAGCLEFISRAMLYKEKGKDYTDYPYGAALIYMYVKVDADFGVKSYTIDVYDQDDNLSQQGLKLNIGDEVQTLYVEEDADESPEWNSVKLEEPVAVTQEPEFEYAGYIPGRDFGCTHCAGEVELSDADIYFRIVGYEVDTEADTETPTYSQKTAMGKLKDNVCAAYPQLTTKEPTLADVVEGLKIAASLAPQHFCFRDANSDGKFDTAEVIWMLQKTADLKYSF
jgi:hypothetical protein